MPEPSSSYHHGNLREALIAAAIHILESEGLKSLSLRRIARDAGVSQAAPYGHFKDKSELLMVVINEGHAIFAERMRREAAGSKGPAYIAGLGRGYIYFALEHPALFELMFSGNLQDNPKGTSENDSPQFSEGYRLLDDGLSQFPIKTFGDDTMSRVLSWGVVHGIADLLLGQRFSPELFGYDTVDAFIHASMDKFVGEEG
jgi:AcrR family transcriptional regulator